MADSDDYRTWDAEHFLGAIEDTLNDSSSGPELMLQTIRNWCMVWEEQNEAEMPSIPTEGFLLSSHICGKCSKVNTPSRVTYEDDSGDRILVHYKCRCGRNYAEAYELCEDQEEEWQEEPVEITHAEFEERLLAKCRGITAESILTLDGVYEAVSEHFNNDIIEEWRAEHGKRH